MRGSPEARRLRCQRLLLGHEELLLLLLLLLLHLHELLLAHPLLLLLLLHLLCLERLLLLHLLHLPLLLLTHILGLRTRTRQPADQKHSGTTPRTCMASCCACCWYGLKDVNC